MNKPRKVILMGFVLVDLLVGFAPLPLPGSQPTEHTIRVSARSFEFSPAEIFVNQGDRVSIELISTDVVHGIYLDVYDLQFSADPGHSRTLTFTANQPGTFRFRCSVTCGDLHPFMIGKLHVGSNILLWRGIGLAGVSLIGLLALGSNRYWNQQGISQPE